MKQKFEKEFLRRDLFRFAIAGTGSVLVGSQVSETAFAQPVDLKSKRRVRYQADSPEVRNFYRVNSYPAR
jgi:hypothetical protein